MPIPALITAGAGESVKALQKGLSTPMIGRKKTTIIQNKDGSQTIIENSFQLRAWEFLFAGLGAVGLYWAVDTYVLNPEKSTGLGFGVDTVGNFIVDVFGG
jgi:hypothetical protein